jgi:hypothetical protein
MSRHSHKTLPPEELVDPVAVNQEFIRQLAKVEADPSQKRPTKKPSVRDRIHFMDHDTYADLGVQPITLQLQHWQEQP